MSIAIDQTALKALTATLQKLQASVSKLARLDETEDGPNTRLCWISVRDSRPDDDISKRLIQSMEASAKRRAAEMGALLRAEALEQATAEIDTLRAVLCSQAASATIELARIVRDARERG